jgi:hypothetical protein
MDGHVPNTRDFRVVLRLVYPPTTTVEGVTLRSAVQFGAT